MTFCFIIDINPYMKSWDLQLDYDGVVRNKKDLKIPTNYEINNIQKFSPIDLTKALIESLIQSLVRSNITIPIILSTNSNDRGCILSYIGNTYNNIEEKVKNIETINNNKFIDKNNIPNYYNFSYSLTLNISILNKYRLRDNTDRFGYGLNPWTIEPINVILFTDYNGLILNKNLSFLKSVKENQARLNLSEFIKEPFRWDQHIYLIILNNTDNLPSLDKNDLIDLCKSSGGEIFKCSSIKEAVSLSKEINAKITMLPPTVVVKFTVNEPNYFGTQSPLQVHLYIKSPGMWTIPENYWVDLGVDQLKPRSAHPLLQLHRKFHFSNNEHTPNKFLHFAKEIDLKLDSYELCTVKVGGSNSIDSNNISITNYLKGYGINNDEMLFVSVDGSGRPNENGLVVINGNSITSKQMTPFGILSPINPGKSNGSYELILLPYNFPHIFSLMKIALDKIKINIQINNPNQYALFANQWKNEMNVLISNIPQYLQGPIVNFINSCRLGITLQLPIEAKIHRTPYRKVLKSQAVANNDIINLEIAVKESTIPTDINITTLSLDSTNNIVKAINLPNSLQDIESIDLLNTWEKMRLILYGGSGITARDLSIKNHKKTIIPYEDHTVNENEWMYEAIGAKFINEYTTTTMSDYLPLLARREALRDPLLLDPPIDEDTPAGILKRKLDINFGNRFKKTKKSSSKSSQLSTNQSDDSIDSDQINRGIEIEGIAGLYTSTILRNDITSTNLSTSFNTSIDKQKNHNVDIDDPYAEKALANTKLFFMDTPNPYYNDDNESIDLSYSPNSSITTSPVNSPLVNKSTINGENDNAVKIDDINKSTSSNNIDTITLTINSPSVVSVVSSNNTEALPEGWIQCFSSRQNRPYWFNSATGKSVWEFPKNT